MRRLTLYSSIVAGAAAAALLVTSCATIGIGVREFPDGTPEPPGRAWLTCSTPETADEVTATIIGGQSATLTLARGHRLDVPANALDSGESRVVTFRQLPGAGAAVRLLPYGSGFKQQLRLTIAYGGRGCGAVDPNDIDIFRIRNGIVDDASLPKPPVTPRTEHVQGLLTNFSEFAIAR